MAFIIIAKMPTSDEKINKARKRKTCIPGMPPTVAIDIGFIPMVAIMSTKLAAAIINDIFAIFIINTI